MQQLTGHRAAAHAPRLACCRFSTPQRRPASRLTCRARSGSSTLDGMFKPWNNYAEYDSDDTPRVLVVGAGVAGLTTAVRLLDELRGVRIIVVADKYGSDTTTHGAAGVWMPFKLSDTPQDLIDEWGDETFVHLVSLVHSEAAVQAGVQMCYAHNLLVAPEPDPFWAGSVQGFRRLSEWELGLFSEHVDWASIQAAAATQAAAAKQAADDDSGSSRCSNRRRRSSSSSDALAAATPTAFVDGYSFNTVVCEGRLYLRWLTQRLQAAPVQFEQRKLSSLAELREEGWDVIVNASGLGASTLLPDEQSYPIRGQVMRVRAPWVQQCVFAEWPDGSTTYVIPNRDSVVLGGTAQVGDSGREVRVDDSRAIADRAMQVVPSLKGAELLDQWVGLRPGRKSLRVELEAEGKGDEAPRIVHNYAHGGAGLTLAWGTAGHAVKLVAEALGREHWLRSRQ